MGCHPSHCNAVPENIGHRIRPTIRGTGACLCTLELGDAYNGSMTNPRECMHAILQNENMKLLSFECNRVGVQSLLFENKDLPVIPRSFHVIVREYRPTHVLLLDPGTSQRTFPVPDFLRNYPFIRQFESIHLVFTGTIHYNHFQDAFDMRRIPQQIQSEQVLYSGSQIWHQNGRRSIEPGVHCVAHP